MPAQGDLAYPERLIMMNDINVQLLNENDEKNYLNCENNNVNKKKLPIDLHCLWYPTVRRTLMCLKKLFNCLEVNLF